jgi:uncharacterized protein YkwD
MAAGRRVWLLSTFGIIGALLVSKPVLGWPTDLPPLPNPVLGPCTPGQHWGTVDPVAAARVLALINAIRADRGLPPLAADPALSASATWKSLHMGRFDYFDHADPAPPVARSPFQRAVACGYPNPYIGEDIAAGQTSPDEAVEDWLNSPEHRRIIEGPDYTQAGVGVAQSPQGRLYWTLDVGRRGI